MIRFNDAWGFSKLDCFRECPRKFLYAFIEKRPQPGSAAMDRGSRIHEDIEAYLRGWVLTLPNEALEWQEKFDELKQKTFICEQAWGFDKDWKLLKDWFQPEVWLRAKSDGHFVEGNELTVLDWKTGKFKVPSTEQVEIYAVAGSCVYPQAEKVTTEMWYIDTGNVYSREYTRAHLEELKKKYAGYAAPLYTEEQWKPAPSRNCRWCAYSKAKEGPCDFQ